MLFGKAEDRATRSADRAVAKRTGTASWRDLFTAGNMAVSAMLTGGVAIHALSLRVVATILPSVVAEIGGLRFFAWATTLAMVGSIWGAALAAVLANSRGLKGAYRVSLVLFASGSTICAVAPNMMTLLIGRLFQGFGGGLLTALAYTTIRRVFVEALRTRAIVLVSGIWGVAALCGPLLGGVLAGWGFWGGPSGWTFRSPSPLGYLPNVRCRVQSRQTPAGLDLRPIGPSDGLFFSVHLLLRWRSVVSEEALIGVQQGW